MDDCFVPIDIKVAAEELIENLAPGGVMTPVQDFILRLGSHVALIEQHIDNNTSLDPEEIEVIDLMMANIIGSWIERN